MCCPPSTGTSQQRRCLLGFDPVNKSALEARGYDHDLFEQRKKKIKKDVDSSRGYSMELLMDETVPFTGTIDHNLSGFINVEA